jgi:amino acid adenylation domain-containing protein
MSYLVQSQSEQSQIGSVKENLTGVLKDEPVPPQSQLIVRRPGEGPWPLSFAQERIWFLHQFAAGSPVYNVPIAVQITGALDVAALQKALQALVARHEALRTIVVSLDGAPAQAIQADKSVDLPVLDLSSDLSADLTVLPEEKQRRLEQAISDFCQQTFDLERDLLLKPCLIRGNARDHTLVLNLHHICADGPSMGILHQELVALYQSFDRGDEPELPPLPIQYADFAAWQRQGFTREALARQLSYWRAKLEGAPPYLELPTDSPRPAVQTYEGARHFFQLPTALAARLRDLSRRENVSLFMTLLAGFEVLLQRYTGQEDIVVGTPVANRPRPEIEGLIGFFLNTLALRIDLSGDPTFRELLARVRQTALDAYGNYELPFEMLLEELRPARDLSRSPVFQVMFTLQNAPTATIQLRDQRWVSRELDTGTSKFDLFMVLQEKGQELGGYVEYNTGLFELSTIERMLSHFERLLEGVSSDSNQKISLLPLLGPEERQRIVVGFNDTRASYPSDQCIHQLFEAQVERTPEKVAVICGNDCLNYRELNRRANQLARKLKSSGVGRESFVGVFLDRSINMVVGLLAILKTGGAWVPLDPSYPKDWLDFILEDSQATLVLTEKNLLANLPKKTSAICLDRDWPQIARETDGNPENEITSHNLAYVIYTSGSTGIPKGVLGLHRASVNRFAWMWKQYPFAAGEVCCQKTSLNFVDSIWEIFGPLLQGVPNVIIPDDLVKDPLELVRIMASERISRIVLVPSLLRVLLDAYSGRESSQKKVRPHPKLWICSGEALDPGLCLQFKKVFPESMLLNLYGSSEVAADVTYYPVDDIPENSPTLPIGKPIANTQIHLLDSHMQIVPLGVVGEIYAGGDNLARGYHRRPQLTTERFISSPLAEFPAMLYRTGDRGRRRADGVIEYLGRVDQQVKIRGFRVELGQVESTLMRHKAVEAAAVMLQESEADKSLVAYVVAKPDKRLVEAELRTFVKQSLPEYMVPLHFVMLSKLPLMPNGKINRGALPKPNEEARKTDRGELLSPGNPTEEELAKIVRVLLGRGPVAINENFFDLGFHSLLVSRLLLRVNRAFERRLSLADIFRAPTIEQLARLLNIQEEDGAAHFKGVVPIRQSEGRPALFCVRGGASFRPLAKRLRPDQPFLGLDLPQQVLEQLPKPYRIEDLAAAFIQIMQAVQPQGPYCLAGLCVNGVIAYEMAKQLEERGERVGMLALFDSQNPICYWDYQDYRLRYYFEKTKFHVEKLTRVRVNDVPMYVSERWEGVQRRANAFKWRFFHGSRKPGSHGVPEDLNPVVHPAAWEYRPKPYSGKIVLFQSTDWPNAPYWDYEQGWRNFALGGIQTYRIPGAHLEMFTEPNCKVVAEKLTMHLDEGTQNSLSKPTSDTAEVVVR